MNVWKSKEQKRRQYDKLKGTGKKLKDLKVKKQEKWKFERMKTEKVRKMTNLKVGSFESLKVRRTREKKNWMI